ncbi:MAG TPA: transcription elongation factor GreA [Candidatus Paceibacterota bacterium]|jgi:transcription elongation factor GreA|nr:transcription elongation factor GreA [Candidatus Paceibacterota bacterium]
MKEYLTKENKEALEAEHKQLTTVKRKEIISAIEYAKSLGDLSENAEYHIAREEQGKLEERIAVIENILKHAEVVDRSSDGIVGVGATVVIQKQGESNTRTFTIVGSEETDMLSGKISYKSPIGAALNGKKKGDSITVSTPKGDMEYEVISVS